MSVLRVDVPVARTLLAVAALVGTPLSAQLPTARATSDAHGGRSVPSARAVRTTSTIRLDGRLDEAAWQTAPVTDQFTQIDPDEGKPASQRTEVRVVYDDDALYVGVRLHDTGRVTARLGRRDMPLGDSDWFGLMIDSYHDHRTAFGFDVNPAGVRRDEVKTITVDDNSWDPVWDVATSIDAGGWIAEYRVPFSQLRFGSASAQMWGVQFERIIGRNNEYVVSTFIPKSEQGGVPRYGHLEGLSDLRTGKRLEILPYVVQRAEYVEPGANPFRTDQEYFTSAGVDFLFRATTNLTLNATVNPDFGQVEVDPAVVNLGVYETFFDEKRPFFIEGSEIFNFGADGTSGGQLFYSRRIGRSPSLFPPSPEADMPTATTILGAGKLSGKVGGWSVGFLEAVTAREDARFRSDEIPDGEFAVEPLSNYFVGRARREVRGGQTFIGGIVSAVHRDLETDALENTLHSSGYAGGIDFRHEWSNRSWVVRGDAEASRVEGSARAITRTQRQSNHFFQRPDAEHLEYDTTATSLTGYSVNVALGKQAGTHWRGQLAAALTSPEYEVNDLGFSYRTDRRDFDARLTYVENRPGTVLRRWQLTGTWRAERNFDWQPIQTLASVNAFVQTLGYWSANFQVNRGFEALDDRLTRGGPIATRPANTAFSVNLNSDGRKPITLGMFAFTQDADFGGWTWQAGATVGVKSSSRWNLTMGPTVFRNHVPAQFVGSVADVSYAPTYGRRYIFAPLHQTEVGLESRFNVTFTPRLSLETYVQPLISTADFGSTKQLVAPKTFEFTPFASNAPEGDFNFRSLRGNAVMRWEWRAGSTVYVAWQQSRVNSEPLGDFSFGRDRRALFGTAPDNIFLLKVSYWLNP